MGLDVYLYHYADFALAERAEEAHEAETSALWKEWGERDVETYRAKVAEAELRNGMKGYHHESVTKIENPSAVDPKHLFKVGYFRSSYNEGGINRILRAHVGTDLDGIFGVGNDYHVRPDWAASRVRAEAAIEKLWAVRADPLGRLRASFVRALPYRPDTLCTSEEDALASARKAITDDAGRDHRGFGASYSNAAGEFFLRDEALEVVAMLIGQEYGSPGLWVVRRAPEDWLDWYIKALQIVVETIDYVIARSGQAGEFVLHWSS